MTTLSLVGSYDEGYNRRDANKADRIARGTELEVYRHRARNWEQEAKDKSDSETIGEVCKAALDEELNLLEYGTMRAGQSLVKAELVANKVRMAAAANDRRIARRFGNKG
jgi:hypothetical protein